jgi:hypothetical protein
MWNSGCWPLASLLLTHISSRDFAEIVFFSLLPVPGWFFDWTQSYDLAFYFSGGSVLLGGVTLFLCALPCWDKKKADIDRPDIQYTSNCDKVASVA